MKWSLYIGKVSGIKIFVHWTFIFLILYVIQVHLAQGHGFNEILLGLGFVGVVFVCITLHELGHALAAQHYHFNTKDIYLLPIGGLARLEGIPEKPIQELVVAIMGPIVNIVIAAVLYLTLQLTDAFPDSMKEVRLTPENFWFHLYAVNLFLAIFNLIPAFPMDGGRIFRALLSFKFSRARATRIATGLGQIIAIGFIIFGFYMSPMLIFIGLFILLGAQAEMNFEQVKASLRGKRVRDVLMQQYSVVRSDEPLSHAVALLLNSQEKAFVVKENDEIKGTLSWKDVVAALSEHKSEALIGQVMNKDPVRFKVDELLENVMLKIQETPHDLYLVYAGSEFAGVLNMENISEYLILQNALKQQ